MVEKASFLSTLHEALINISHKMTALTKDKAGVPPAMEAEFSGKKNGVKE